jgi:RHS repeat-associated protein
VKQVSGGYPLYYLWSSVLGEPVAEVTSGGVYRAYVYGPSGQLLALQSADANFYWTHTDRLGSGRKLTNASGTVVYRAEFDPHGQQLYEWASGGATFLNSHKFTGYERDWATNLDYAKARSYTRFRNRFLQPDPMGVAAADLTNPQSLNRYNYVGNDPANFVDPSGMFLEGPSTPIRIETWEPGPWWNYFIWVLLFGWGGGGGGHQPIGGGGVTGGGSGGGGTGGGAETAGQQTPKQAAPCPPSRGISLSYDVNGSAFAGFGAGTSVTGAVGVFLGIPGGNPSKQQAVGGAYASGGALFLNHSAPSIPENSDSLRPSTGQGFVLGAGAGLGTMFSVSRNATASGYNGVTRSYTFIMSGIQISASFNPNSKIPASVGFGLSFGPGIGLVSLPVKTVAKDTSSKNCQ